MYVKLFLVEYGVFSLVLLIFVLHFIGKESKLKLKAQTELGKTNVSWAVDVLVFSSKFKSCYIVFTVKEGEFLECTVLDYHSVHTCLWLTLEGSKAVSKEMLLFLPGSVILIN